MRNQDPEKKRDWQQDHYVLSEAEEKGGDNKVARNEHEEEIDRHVGKEIGRRIKMPAFKTVMIDE